MSRVSRSRLGMKISSYLQCLLDKTTSTQIFNPFDQADNAVLVTNDVIEDVGALREQMQVCDVEYLKSKISD